MKKKYLIVGAIALLISVAGFILWLTLPKSIFYNSISTYKYYIDVSKDIILDFKDANISINEWDKSYVEVTYDNVFGGKINLDISTIENTITLNSDLDFSGLKHLSIRVPNAVICVNANLIRAKSGTFRAIKAKRALLRYCSLADGYSCEGEELEIRESKLIGSGIIKNEGVNIRECDIDDIVLSADNPRKKIDAHLRELTGKSIKLDAMVCNDLFVELKDPNLDKFIMDYVGSSGTVTVIGGSINKIDNNSTLIITRYRGINRK